MLTLKLLEKMTRLNLIAFLIVLSNFSVAQTAPQNFKNPILPGFNPDPSICRVGEDYYMVTSSFVWFPGIPIYHSKDLVNWQLIGHGITDTAQVNFTELKDKNGIWAVTIRHHDGLFYLITTCSGCGGNFYITSTDPRGKWSKPVWIKDAPGIDPSLFWDDDGKCYYQGNTWDFKKQWASQCAVWTQELDLKQNKLVGERRILSYGYANNAGYAESPHIYKIDGKYLLLNAEGGTDAYHAVAAHHSNSVLGPFTSDKVNPVLSHRQLGKDYPIKAVGHADLVQTQNGEWWAVALGMRLVNGEVPLSRETFLCKVNFENGTPIFNPGYGKVLLEQQRPDLPWTPFAAEEKRDEFSSGKLAMKWHFVRTPKEVYHNIVGGKLSIKLLPAVVDSLVSPAMIIQRIKDHQFSASTKLTFQTIKSNEQAGLIVYRNNESYYLLMKESATIVLIKKYNGTREIIARMPYTKQEVFLKAQGDGLNIRFSFGESEKNMVRIAETQSLKVIAESDTNKFNGPGIGVYATSNGQISNNTALFDWFEYSPFKTKLTNKKNTD